MKQIPQVSIITVTYNSSTTINKFLLSMKRGNNLKYIKEVIIVENDSPDRLLTQKLCSQINLGKKIIFKNNKNVGFGSSCNYGVNFATTKLLLFLNPDTELVKDTMEKLVNHHINNKSDFTGGKSLDYSHSAHRTVFRIPNVLVGLFEFSNLGKFLNIKIGTKYFYYEDINILESNIDRTVEGLGGAFILISREPFKLLGGFDRNIFMYLEDVDICARATKLGFKLRYCPHAIIHHIGGASSKNKYHISHKAWFESRKYYFRKHFGLLANIIIQPVFILDEYLLKILRKI